MCGTFISAWQPAHNLGLRKTQSLQGPVAMLTALLFLTPLLLDSWPAISLFAAAGKFNLLISVPKLIRETDFSHLSLSAKYNRTNSRL